MCKELTLQKADELIARYPQLHICRDSLLQAIKAMCQCYKVGGKVIVCGNGGSASDAEHIVGELMKGFKLPRKLRPEMCEQLTEADPERGPVLAACLQQGLPAIALSSHQALNTAFMNDVDGNLMFAQQLGVLGCPGDVFLAISTSGNSKNVFDACVMAKAKGMKIIALSGKTGGMLKNIADLSLIMPGDETYMIQELHLPVYHCLCLMLEEHFFGQS